MTGLMTEEIQTQASAPGSIKELEIHTIPDKFYGAALKTRIEEKKAEAPVVAAPETKKRSIMVPVIVGVVLLLAVSGGFVYFNRDLIFPKPAPAAPEVPPPPVPQPPASPAEVAATSTNPQSVILNWTDKSDNESGFRVERDQGTGSFTPVTNLPPNSTSFLDASVEPGMSYSYRIIALNIAGESAPSEATSATVPNLPPIAPPSPTLPPAGLDSDSDGITDLEETLYVTDARTPDTDADGFLDGNEVFHLYNPAGQAPVRLLDSSLVKIVTASMGWVMSIPASWSIAMDATDGSRATIDTKHGELFKVTIENNPEKKPILQWYLDTHPGVASTQVLKYRSKGGYEGVIGADLLSTFIPWGDRVFVMTYDLDGQTFINYRTTYSMMLNSLVLSGLPKLGSAESETPLPFEPSATTSGVIAQPVPVEAEAAVTSSAEQPTTTP